MSKAIDYRMALYRSSVLVSGSHYSITTLLGAILAESTQFHMVHEPVNHESTISFRTVPMRHVYPCAVGAEYERLRAGLIRLMLGEGLAGALVHRATQVRSLRDIARLGRLVQRELPLVLRPRPAIFKAPLLAFTARSMQQVDGMKVVLGLRHPVAWIESVVRRDGGIDAQELMQEPLLDALPEFADRIRLFAREPQPPLQQAILLWQLVQTFHARYLLDDPRTMVVRQEDLVADPPATIAALFAFCGVANPPPMDAFIASHFSHSDVDNRAGQGDYVRRDAQAVLRKWRERVPVADQQLIRRETGELAARFGYTDADW